ncbi:MAG: hypothetical protein J3R72DRAFT_519456 [Linnemannia gamsii]|nr:MAG: hypothetical protein J3R72DRAFT_519456 [Linnemannia gamsii]
MSHTIIDSQEEVLLLRYGQQFATEVKQGQGSASSNMEIVGRVPMLAVSALPPTLKSNIMSPSMSTSATRAPAAEPPSFIPFIANKPLFNRSLPSWLLRSYKDEDISDYRYGWISNQSVLATWRNRQRFIYRTSPALCALDVNTTRLLGPCVPSGSPSAEFLAKRRKHQRTKKRRKSREKTGEEIAKEEQKKAEDRIKKRRALTSRAARGKAFRESQEDEPAEKGRLDPTTIISNHLKRKYEVESLDYGTVHDRLKDTVCASINDSDVQKAIIKDIETVIYEMVCIASEAWRSASLAILKFTTKNMRATEDPLTKASKTVANASTILAQNWQLQAATKDPSKDHNQIVWDHNNTYKQAGRTHPVLNGLITGELSEYLKGVGKNIEQAVQRHYMENIKVLVERVKAFNPTWALHVGRQAIASVNKNGVSSKYGNLATFCLLNAQLPSDKRMKIPPQTLFTDRFITITETELLLALKYYKHVSQHTIKYLNLDKLRSDRSPYIAHPGDLYHQLFVSDSVGYSRSGSLMHPDILYQSSPKTPYLDLRQNDNKAYNAARESVVAATEMDARAVGAKELYASRRKALLDIVDPFFKDASINKTRLDKNTIGQLRERIYILKGSTCTDGHQLHLLAFHTTRPYVPYSETFEVLTGEDYQKVLIDERKFRLLSMNPDIKDTTTATVFDPRFPNRVKNITISQGLQIDPERKWKRRLNRAKKNFKHGDNEISELEQSIKAIEYPEADPSLENDEKCLVGFGTFRRCSHHVDCQGCSSFSSVLRLISIQKEQEVYEAGTEKPPSPRPSTDFFPQLGCKGKWVCDRNKPRPRPVIVAGDGEFGSRSGGLTRHLQVFRRMKRRAEALDYLMVSASEFKTSQV